MTLEFSWQIVKKTQISNFIKIRPVKAEVFHADRWADMTKLIFAFRNFANVPKHQLFITEKALKISASIKIKFIFFRVVTTCRLVNCYRLRRWICCLLSQGKTLSNIFFRKSIITCKVVSCDKPQGTVTPTTYLPWRSFLLCFVQWRFNIYSTYCQWNKNTNIGHRWNRNFLREEAEVFGTTFVQIPLCSNWYLKKWQRKGSTSTS